MDKCTYIVIAKISQTIWIFLLTFKMIRIFFLKISLLSSFNQALKSVGQHCIRRSNWHGAPEIEGFNPWTQPQANKRGVGKSLDFLLRQPVLFEVEWYSSWLGKHQHSPTKPKECHDELKNIYMYAFFFPFFLWIVTVFITWISDLFTVIFENSYFFTYEI